MLSVLHSGAAEGLWWPTSAQQPGITTLVSKCYILGTFQWHGGQVTLIVKTFLGLLSFSHDVQVSHMHFYTLLGRAVINVSILSHLCKSPPLFTSRCGCLVKPQVDVLGSRWAVNLPILRALSLLSAPAGASTPSHPRVFSICTNLSLPITML